MKNSNISINERRDTIFSKLLEFKEINVKETAEMLSVSELTIRRDLTFFEDKGLIERFYGGAKIIVHNKVSEPLLRIERIKKALAKKASEFINSGDIIFLNTSSTALYIIQYLEDKEVTIVTNNGKAIKAPHSKNVSVILTGGELRTPKNSMVGDYALKTLNSISASHSFLGCSGISASNGMSTSIHSEVSVNVAMISNTKGQVYIVADHTKIESQASFIVGDINNLSGLITDDLTNPEFLEQFSRYPNFKVIIVSTLGLK